MTRISCAALVALLALAACVDNRTSVEISGRAAPGDATTCLFSAGGQKVLGPGVLDVSYASLTGGSPAYTLAVYVKNNLVDPSVIAPGSVTAVTDAKAWRAENARIRLNPQDYLDRYGAVPGLLPASGEALLALQGQTTPPGASSVEVVDTLSSTLGQAVLAAAPATGLQRLVLGITLQGRTLDGARLDTAEWYYAVDVCQGCLPVPACTPTQRLGRGNCFNFGQDNSPLCLGQ